MDPIDIIVFPFYVLLFALIFSIRRKRIEDPILKKYHRQGFWIKIVSTIAFIIFSAFIAKGDSMFLYYPEGINIAKLIVKDFSNIQLLFSPGKDFDQNLLADSFNKGYFNSESNYFVARLVAVLSFITMGSYSAITLIFSMISFAGVWRLYRFFYEQYPHLHKQFAIAIIYLPTFVFWSSGILKDPLCTGMIGFLTFSVYNLLIKRNSIFKNSIVALISAFILGTIKLYILISYLPFLLLFVVLHYVKNTNSALAKSILLASILIVISLSFYLLSDRLKEEMGDFALDKIAVSVKTTQSNFENLSSQAESSFSLGVDFDGSAISLLKIAPAAIAATLFRPYLWESKKVSTLLSSVESLVLMLFTLYVFFKVRPVSIVAGFVKDPIILCCFSFAILFALFVGATTLNFGTLVRYKVPCMPFYIISLLLLLDRKKNARKVPDNTAPANNNLQL
jgi:hypothetical protein